MGYIGNQPYLGVATGESIADGSIGTVDLSDGAITAAKLATTAILDKLGYTPVSTSGTGATGTWGVSISGNAATATTAVTATNVSGGTASVTTVDTTNLEVTNVKAKDGTAAIAIADSTGAVTVSTPTVVSVNSSSDALRITQTGTGNALVVEDSANPDATPLVVDANGRLLVGTSTATTYAGTVTPFVQSAGTTANGGFVTSRWAANTGASSYKLAKSRGAAVGTNAVVASGDSLGSISFEGDDGAAFLQAAQISAEVDGTPGTNDMPGRLTFSTTADGGSSPTERMRITSAGNVGINTASPGYQLEISKANTSFRMTDLGANSTYVSAATISTQANIGVARQGGNPSSAFLYAIGNSSYLSLNGLFGTANLITTESNGDLSIDVGGSERMRITASSGNVGIGTASPSFKLVAANSSTDGGWIYSTGAVSVLGLGGYANSGNGAFQITYDRATGGITLNGGTRDTPAARVTIDNSGNVGIGTSNPGDRLDVVGGNIRIASGNTVRWVDAGNIRASIQGDSSSNAIFSTAGSERMRILSDGSVIIGSTVSYGGLLSINRAQTSSIADLLTLRDGSAGTTFNLQTYGDPAAGTANRFNYDGAYLAFRRSGTEQMRITSGGDISIGRAASSTVRLFVQGANNGTDNALVCYNSSEQNLFYARNDGVISTGTASNSPYNLTTGSSANVFVDSDGILRRSTSSLRYKSNVADATHGLTDVLKLRSVTYKGKSDGDTVFGGLIAEEVHDAGLTEFVAYDSEGRPDALHYGNMVALLVKAVQELKAELDALKAQHGN